MDGRRVLRRLLVVLASVVPAFVMFVTLAFAWNTAVESYHWGYLRLNYDALYVGAYFAVPWLMSVGVAAGIYARFGGERAR